MNWVNALPCLMHDYLAIDPLVTSLSRWPLILSTLQIRYSTVRQIMALTSRRTCLKRQAKTLSPTFSSMQRFPADGQEKRESAEAS
ncbi:hypothetical protein BC938DRAFT_472422 [Jimgerdemannia flammicorona]|uniref:Uncharacterized protein n=1 Tax=Jimgerdemannia flammicorona TaxID=994334 RepID=A0A433Q643_9FUNG|nr:hypothetical protein BC938DRAFT_472422 [Jimgerdemannia flammicorona]